MATRGRDHPYSSSIRCSVEKQRGMMSTQSVWIFCVLGGGSHALLLTCCGSRQEPYQRLCHPCERDLPYRGFAICYVLQRSGE